MFSDHKKEWKNRQKDTRIEKMGMTEDNENLKKYLQVGKTNCTLFLCNILIGF